MTTFKNILGAIFILTLLYSCGGSQTDNTKMAPPETPKALQDSKLEFNNYSRSSDLTDELYQELVEKTPVLKKLEDDLEAFRQKPGDLKDKFNEYDSKSSSYYSSVNHRATAIKDSLLRMKIISLITTSSKKYTSKTAELNSLLNRISNNDVTLSDHHLVLKIVLTLPIIEKYQDNNKPNNKQFKDLINEQEKLILRTDSLTPKY